MASSPLTPSPHKEKILIALSDASLAVLVSQRLLKEGYAPAIAKTGEGALEYMRNENPELALIDLILPGKNGYDVLSEKSFDRMITKIPVILVSNNGSTIEMNKIPSTQSVKDYIIKTHVDPQEVVEKIAAIFGYPAGGTPPQEIHDKPHGKKILWVEDDKLLGTILLKKFQSLGYAVSKAENADEAFAFIEAATPDIIILDILLPGLSGFDIIQKIKMQDKFKQIPVIMLSNMSKSSDIEKAKMLGVQKFLVKAAVSLDEIVKEVAGMVK